MASFSEEGSCVSGVPEGLVIGPLLFPLYINDLPDALGYSVVPFADDMKMVLPRTQSCHLLLSLSYAWAWTGE